MQLEPWKERVVAEADELEAKLMRLSAFIASKRVNAISREEAVRLIEQQTHMKRYLAVLRKRIVHFTDKPKV